MSSAPRLAVAALALLVAACDGLTVIVTTGPSTGPITVAIVHTQSSACGLEAARFDLVVTASRDVDLSHVTLQLADGSHVGGPAVTFPEGSLTSQFGSTRVSAGSTRAFRLEPQFACPAWRPTRIDAEVLLIDTNGTSHTTHATGPLP